MATSGKLPSFFKLVPGEQFTDKLKIPTDFLLHLQGNLPHLCHLQTAAQTWPVHVEMVNLFYLQKDLNEFLQDNGLKYGQLLFFHYAGNSHFHVDIIGKSTSGELLVMSETEEADEEDDDVSYKPRKKHKTSLSGKARTKNKEAYWSRSEIKTEKKVDFRAEKDRGGTSSPQRYMEEEEDHENDEEGVDESEHDEETEDDQEEEDDHCSQTLNYASSGSRTVASRHHKRRINRISSMAKAQSNIESPGGLSRDERILNAISLEKANAFKPSTRPSFEIS